MVGFEHVLGRTVLNPIKIVSIILRPTSLNFGTFFTICGYMALSGHGTALWGRGAVVGGIYNRSQNIWGKLQLFVEWRAAGGVQYPFFKSLFGRERGH